MASSGTDVFTLTRDQMAAMVAKKLRVLLPSGTLDGQTLSDFGVEFNVMLKNWLVKGLKLWTNYQLQVPMVANQAVYTIGPTGANVTAVRPARVLNEGNFIRQLIGSAAPYDTPLRLISRMEYEEMGSKLSNGVPNSIYYQPTIDTGAAGGVTSPSTGYGTLFVYVTTNSQSLPRTMFLNVQRQLFDISTATSSSEEFDVPSEWFEAVRTGMAYRMADYFEVPEDRQMRLKNEYDAALAGACDWSVEQAPMQIVPDFSTMSTSPYRR